MIAQGDIYQSVSGIVVGHTYIYLKEILPISHRKFFLQTPAWVNWLGEKILELTNENGQ